MSLPECEVIVPTEARRERASLLREALESIHAQEGVRVRPLVVINGPAADSALRSELERDPRLRVQVVARPHLPGALRIGRELVSTPWFGALDDDDVLLPGALALRIGVLLEQSETDVVVTNGYRQEASGQVLQVPDAARVRNDPLRAMLESNWLLPGSWLCRSAAVGPGLFDAMPKYLECTYLGLQFASRFRMRFLDAPTVVWRTATPSSMSKSRDFAIGQVPALRQLLQLELPPAIRIELKRHLTQAFHARAELRLREGAVREAWRDHLRALRGRGGWRYLAFTRVLLRARSGS